MNSIVLISPLSLLECKKILSEQIQIDSFFRRTNIFKRPSSRVVGRIINNDMKLKYAYDIHSLSFICTLSEKRGNTLLNGYWKASLGSNIWGSHEIDKEEIIEFLKEWLKFETAT